MLRHVSARCKREDPYLMNGKSVAKTHSETYSVLSEGSTFSEWRLLSERIPWLVLLSEAPHEPISAKPGPIHPPLRLNLLWCVSPKLSWKRRRALWHFHSEPAQDHPHTRGVLFLGQGQDSPIPLGADGLRRRPVRLPRYREGALAGIPQSGRRLWRAGPHPTVPQSRGAEDSRARGFLGWPHRPLEIGRASCRERVRFWVAADCVL